MENVDDIDELRGAHFRLSVRIIGCNHLRSADMGLFQGSSDPYVVCGLLGRPLAEFRTETVMKSLDPVFDHLGVIECCKPTDSLVFTVWDYDQIGADDLLGELKIDFEDLFPSGIDDILDLTVHVPLKAGKAPATITLQVDCEPIEYPETFSRCFVEVCGATGLRAADWSISGGGKSDPYCIVKIPGKQQSKWNTRCKFKELNPTWNEEDELHDFEEGDTIEFQVFDWDKNSADDLLGSFTMPSSDFYPHGWEGEVPLGKGKLMVKVECVVPVVQDTIIDPGEHVGPNDREPSPFKLRSLDSGLEHRVSAYTRIGRSKKMLESPVDLVLDHPGIGDVSRLHAIIKCWRGHDPTFWSARIYDTSGPSGHGAGPGGGHTGGGTTVDGEPADSELGTVLQHGSVIRFGVREMWTFEKAGMHLRSEGAEVACNQAAANSVEDPCLFRTLRIPSQAVDSALQRCPTWISLVMVVLECRNEPDEPPCVDCIEVQDEVGRAVDKFEAYTLEAQEQFDVQKLLRGVVIGGTVRLRLSSDPKLLAPILLYLEQSEANSAEVYKRRQMALG
mmetsp:Transcript_46722/g.84324  ORF Transcript_46722/g.84324 Transcript_46722/m.84324 type:complete len:561 (+) Transcript_46722:108-1790(+)